MRLPWQRKGVQTSVTSLQMRQPPDPAKASLEYLHWQLRTLQFRMAAPIWTMMSQPNYLFSMYHLAESALLLKIMDNVYQYGRRHWTWVASGSAEATQAYFSNTQYWIESHSPAVMFALKEGRGLLDGTIEYGACGNFNTAFWFIAARLFNIDLKHGTNEGHTSISGNFITMPGTEVIDSHWLGNVWTDSISNEVLRAFQFNGHWFCNHRGTIYDVTSNRTFGSTSDMVWCKLEDLPMNARARFTGIQNPSVYRVRPMNKALRTGASGSAQTMIVPPKYSVKIGKENLPFGSGGFSNWLLTDFEEIPAVLMRKLTTRSSRG